MAKPPKQGAWSRGAANHWPDYVDGLVVVQSWIPSNDGDIDSPGVAWDYVGRRCVVHRQERDVPTSEVFDEVRTPAIGILSFSIAIQRLAIPGCLLLANASFKAVERRVVVDADIPKSLACVASRRAMTASDTTISQWHSLDLQTSPTRPSSVIPTANLAYPADPTRTGSNSTAIALRIPSIRSAQDSSFDCIKQSPLQSGIVGTLSTTLYVGVEEGGRLLSG
ncbi:hypothetical protein BKA63DRAFT_492120 [Paraphoma chrysanthemicola]|nr:hypothetical protein BKA63DRAFT_492120 [Paraphoma chrysanthemicola]